MPDGTKVDQQAGGCYREGLSVPLVLALSWTADSLSDHEQVVPQPKALLFFPLVAWPLFFIDVALGAGWAGSGESRLCNGVTQKKK
jgi:hypothetical protein